MIRVVELAGGGELIQSAANKAGSDDQDSVDESMAILKREIGNFDSCRHSVGSRENLRPPDVLTVACTPSRAHLLCWLALSLQGIASEPDIRAVPGGGTEREGGSEN